MGDSQKVLKKHPAEASGKRARGAMNSAKTAVDVRPSRLTAKAHNCTYNENCKCTAAAIDVAGSGAKVCSKQNAIPLNASARACLEQALERV